MMKKQQFMARCEEPARRAGERFSLNPVVILAQAALESGWGESTLARTYHNFFGMCAAGKANEFWSGAGVQLREGGFGSAGMGLWNKVSWTTRGWSAVRIKVRPL